MNTRAVNQEQDLNPNLKTAHRQVSVTSGAAVGLGTLHVNTRYVIVQVITAAVRQRRDGTAPTASIGFQYAAGDMFVINAMTAINSSFIAESTTATLEIQECV